MKQSGWIRTTYLTRLSQPVQDRVIFQTLCRTRITAVLEVGMGAGIRTGRLLELAITKSKAESLRYLGIDQFEARTADEPGLTLKQAHQLVSRYGVPHRLLPGDPLSVLSRSANSLEPVDLLIVSADQDPESMRRAWFYVPRILRPESLVFVEQRQAGQPNRFQLVGLDEVKTRAEAANPSRRRAA